MNEFGIADDWAHALAPVRESLQTALNYADAERVAGHCVLPAPEVVLRAFTQPMSSVKVLIVGQDPYPTPGHAIGLSFAVERSVRPLPRSLVNIYRELHDDLGIAPAPHGDLSAWNEQGVMLLNRVLTVRAGEAGSHARRGWEAVTQQAVTALAERNKPLVAILWGKPAQALAVRLAPEAVIASAHPSPLSARRGFFGSRPFSRANELLRAQGAEPVDWRVER